MTERGSEIAGLQFDAGDQVGRSSAADQKSTMRNFAELTAQPWLSRLRLDYRLIHQHDRDVVSDGVDPVALDALQAFRILTIFERVLARRTDQNIQ